MQASAEVVLQAASIATSPCNGCVHLVSNTQRVVGPAGELPVMGRTATGSDPVHEGVYVRPEAG